MKRIMLILLTVILLAVVGAVVAVMRLDAQSVRDQVAEAVRGATGKPLVIQEMPSLSLVPLGVKFGAAYWGLSPEGKADPAGGVSASVKSGQVSVQFMPLLSGRIVVDEVRLDSPDIRVLPSREAPKAVGKTPESAAKTPPGQGPIPSSLEIDTLAITNGAVYLELTPGQSLRLSKLNVTLNNLKPGAEMRLDLSTDLAASKPALDAALTLKAKGKLEANRCDLREFSAKFTPRSGIIPAAAGVIALDAQAVYDFTAEKAAPALLKLAVQGSTVELSGEADAKAAAFNGRIKLDTQPRKLAQAFGQTLPLKRGLESFKLQTPLTANAQMVNLGAIQGMLDSTGIEGKLACDLNRTHISGNLKFGALDVDALTASATPLLPPLLPLTPEALAEHVARLLAPDEALAASPRPQQRAQQKTQQPPAQQQPAAVQSRPASGGLPSVDLDLAAASITAAKLQFKDIRAKVRGQGVYHIEPLTLTLGTGGSVNLNISLDAASMQAGVSGKISNVAVGPLMQAMQGKRPVDGTADVNLETLTCAASSAKAAQASLSGRGLATVRGIVLNGVSILPKDAPAGLGSPPTHFEQLTVPFTASSGIVNLAPVTLSSPTLNAKGQGVVRLPQENVDFTADISLLKLTIPVVVSGPFSSVSYGLDGRRALEGLAKSPGALMDTARDLGVTGSQKAGGARQKAGGAAQDLGKAVKGLLGR